MIIVLKRKLFINFFIKKFITLTLNSITYDPLDYGYGCVMDAHKAEWAKCPLTFRILLLLKLKNI